MSADTIAPTVLTVPVGPAVLGRVIDPAGLPLDGQGPLDAAPRRPLAQPSAGGPPPAALLETGIKVVDLFAPIPRGGSVGIYAPPGLGKLVLITELVHRVVAHGGAAVFVGTEAHTYEVTDLMRSMADAGLAAHTAMVFTRIGDPPAAARQAALAGLTIALEVAGAQHDALLVVDRELVDDEVVTELKGALGPRVTLILQGPPTDAPGPVDALIRCAPELGQRALWPAVDRLHSWSRLLEAGGLAADAAEAARGLLRAAPGDPTFSARAERLEQYLTQPFFCAEEYTDIPGEYVSRDRAARDVASICAGERDDAEPGSLRFIGALP